MRCVDQLDLNGNIMAAYNSLYEAGEATGLFPANIYRGCTTGSKEGGYLWAYSERVASWKEVNVSDRQRTDFVEMIDRYERFIYYMIHRKNYILPHEVKDYYQEIVINIWRNYEYFLQNWTGNVRTFIAIHSDFAIGNYRTKLYKYQYRLTALEDWHLYDAVYEDYRDDENIERLLKAISDLPEDDQHVIRLYMDGENLEERALKDGVIKTAYRSKLQRAKLKIYKTRHRHFEGVFAEEKKPSAITLSGIRKGENNTGGISKRKSVYQYDISGQTLIAKYVSAKEAADKNNFQATNIRQAACGRKSQYQNFIWKYEQSDN